MYLKKGFSLVEIMIAVSLLAGLSLVVMNLTKQSTKSSAKFQFDSDVILATNEINAILNDESKCLATFGTSASPNSIDNGISGKKYYISTVSPGDMGYGNSKFKIISYTLTGTAPNGILNILFQNKTIVNSTAPLGKQINLYIEGSPGAITKCRALSGSKTDIWTYSSTGNTIFYNGGIRVGDETQATSCNSSSDEGTQRYNKTNHSMEFCAYNAGPPVSYAWASIGGTSGGGATITPGTTCPPGKTLVMAIWNPKTCTGMSNVRFCPSAGGCTTAGGAFPPTSPPSCGYSTYSSFSLGCATAICTADSYSSVICM